VQDMHFIPALNCEYGDSNLSGLISYAFLTFNILYVSIIDTSGRMIAAVTTVVSQSTPTTAFYSRLDGLGLHKSRRISSRNARLNCM